MDLADSKVETAYRRNYPAVIRKYEGAAVLVGINYDPEKKEHTCEIERLHI